MRYLIDTNVLSELAKDKPSAQVLDWFSTHAQDRLLISAITVGEIAYGIERKEEGKEKESLSDWFESVLLEWFEDSIIALDTEVMLKWGKLRALGRTLPIIDSQIAATTLVSNAVLVTRNTKDFDGIEGLRVVNPFL
ncbi:MAG: type II toxin-antitoxin system VapC family toxin [Coriobacteriia bacterium]|nr:type II toxin-antitoxin system VapC family toxin [Coriobacteriia bacterium]